ncbi:MAG TPA: hypothetical protein VF618_25015 [Thermoanaerobaculia bacterium]
MTTTCPNCGSDRIRRGGSRLWMIYLVLIAAAMVAVLAFKLNAAIVGGIMLALIVIANLVLDQRICADCGTEIK